MIDYELKPGMMFMVIGGSITAEIKSKSIINDRTYWYVDYTILIHNIPTHQYYNVYETTIIDNIETGIYNLMEV